MHRAGLHNTKVYKKRYLPRKPKAKIRGCRYARRCARCSWECLFITDSSCHNKGSLEPSQSLISKFIRLFSIYKVKKISTTARWLGNCIILLLSSLLQINLVAKAGHQMPPTGPAVGVSAWSSCVPLRSPGTALGLWMGNLNHIWSYCCKRGAQKGWDHRNRHFIHPLKRRNITSAVRLLRTELDKEEKLYSIKSCPFSLLDNVTLRLCFTVYRFV